MSVDIPSAGGVPGISGPPDWLSGAANVNLDDVRWNGAMRTAFGTGAADDATFRAVHAVESGQEQLYLSFRAAFVPDLSDEFDFVYLGFRQGSNAAVLRLKVHSTMVSSGPPSGNPPAALGNIGMSTRLPADVADTWTNGSAPGWVNTNARAWLQKSTDVPLDPNNRWAVQIKVPAAAVSGINLSSPFELWYVMQGTLDSGFGPEAVVLGEFRSSAATNANPTGTGKLQLAKFPNPFAGATAWDGASLTSGPASFGGIAIYGNGYSDIRVTNAQWGEGTTIDNGGSNTFIARPRNYRPAGSTIPTGGVGATFRIANWGSLAGNPHDVDFSTGKWKSVDGVEPPIPKPNTGTISTIAGGANPVPSESIELTVNPMSLPPGASLHQCVLVTLSGSGLHFLNDSAFRNMSYDNLSTVEREAEIDVVGPTPQPREVRVVVEKINMPKQLPQGYTEGVFLETRMERLMRGAFGEKLQRVRRALRDRRGDKPEQRLQQLVSALSEADVTQEETDQLFATLRLHVYHDTGERVTNSSGNTVPVWRAQSSFGIYGYHEGPVSSWHTSIDGTGVQRIADTVYSVAMPASGTTRIRVRMQARTGDERPLPEDPIKKGTDDGRRPPKRPVGWLAAILRLLGMRK